MSDDRTKRLHVNGERGAGDALTPAPPAPPLSQFWERGTIAVRSGKTNHGVEDADRPRDELPSPEVGRGAGGEGTSPWRIAVLLSGTGRTLENLLGVIARGELDARIVAAISSVPGVRGLEVARDAGIPHETITRRDFADNAAYTDAIFAALAPARPQLILLCGFLRQLVVPPAWEGRILNIHPALLPQAASYAAGRGYYGERVHRAVLEHGDTVSGATVHLVTNDYDEGPPMQQCEVPIHPDDTPETLGARVFAAECDLYPAAIRRYLAAHPELCTPPLYAISRR